MGVKENRSGKQTKEWILETAVRLFNQYGTHAVSTKRIAMEMGISPGNLFYHFNKKEKIILEIFRRMSLDFTVGQDDDTSPPLTRFLNLMRSIIAMWRKCPFFQRELVVLLKKDEKLKSLYLRDKDIFRQKTKLLFKEMVDTGILRSEAGSDGFEALYTIGWIIVDFWISFLDINDQGPTEENLIKGIDLIVQAWRPYLTEEALREFTKLREEISADFFGN